MWSTMRRRAPGASGKDGCTTITSRPTLSTVQYDCTQCPRTSFSGGSPVVGVFA